MSKSPELGPPSGRYIRPPTRKQVEYAESLVVRLREGSHDRAGRFGREVEECVDIGVMSRLIDRMKEELDVIKEADNYVERSHYDQS